MDESAKESTSDQEQDVDEFLLSEDELLEKRRKTSIEYQEIELIDENAWDLFNVFSKPEHEEFNLVNDKTESTPILSNVIKEHGISGLNTGDVIEIIGNQQSGKTQLLYQYLLCCILPPYLTVTQSTQNNQTVLLDLAGHHSRVIWIDLHLSFNLNRLYDVYMVYMKRKVINHNDRIHNGSKFKTENKFKNPNHRHSMPAKLNDLHKMNDFDEMDFDGIDIEETERIPINEKRFLKSNECKFLWKYVESKVILIEPLSPIQLIVSIHKLRSMLNELYSKRPSDVDINNILQDETQKYHHDDDHQKQDDEDMEEIKDDEELCDIDKYKINNILSIGDSGARLLIIDDINTFFNELSANHERDSYYSSLSSHLIDLCQEFGLFIIFSRYATFKSEKEWLKQHLPTNYILQRQRNKNFTLNQQDYYHNKFGKIELEKKAIFVIFLYRETMKYVDSTISNPTITNDIDLGFSKRKNGNQERALFLTGNEDITKQLLQRLKEEEIDPLVQIRQIQQNENYYKYKTEEYNIIRGLVMTKDVWIGKVIQGRQNKKKEYENAKPNKKMIRFYAKITKYDDIVFQLN